MLKISYRDTFCGQMCIATRWLARHCHDQKKKEKDDEEEKKKKKNFTCISSKQTVLQGGKLPKIVLLDLVQRGLESLPQWL